MVLAVEKRVTSTLMEPSSIEKILEIDSHIGKSRDTDIHVHSGEQRYRHTCTQWRAEVQTYTNTLEKWWIYNFKFMSES